MQTLSLQSPAKLNLMLHITGQRPDGYHDLQTVFQFINLNDDLEFRLTDSTSIQRVQSNTQIAAHDDLIIKAARLLQQRYAVSAGVEVTHTKRIPVGAGLGGGSSNAATTLMALNTLWQLELSNDELQQTGRQLGADVPIFIYGKSAWAEGVGDQFSSIQLPKSWYLIINPRIFVSTAEIFASKDLTRDCHPLTIRAFLDGEGVNVCQPVACKLYPEIQSAIDWLSNFSPARMTGTGASVFASFDSAEKAKTVQSQLPEKWTGYVVEGMHNNPVTQVCFKTGR
jgi:4-diphosphocytidyl-2-C-methyl-D-erythritol kinase